MMHSLLLAISALVPVIPQPAHVTPIQGTYAVPKTLVIAASSKDERNVAEFTAAFLRTRGIVAHVQPGASGAQITLAARANTDAALGSEGYHLRVSGSGISITANSGAGLFYGLQTLEQLFPSDPANNSLAGFDIVDKPAFPWRGIMLDVSRHFYSVQAVEHFIDVAAHYKLNRFHWHLSDDQGWRVQIKRYPRLTSIGSCRAGSEVDHNPLDIKPGKYCGYYTQAQIKQVVAYAAKRYVTIVPEIDMPGHSSAAIAAYPWLGCTGKPRPVSPRWGGSYPICPTEKAIAFEENVLAELMQLFPGPYIHTGGDEVPFGPWQHSAFVHGLMQREHLRTYPQVQAYFERRIEKFVESKGRRMVGWDEVLDGGISRSAVIMSWRGVEGGIKAAKLGNQAVMSPDGPLYFDAAQGDHNDEPESIGGLSTLQMVYNYNPYAGLTTQEQKDHILGVQANIWTEWIANVPYLYYMAFPRELALSEIAWAPRDETDWDSFVARTSPQYLWLERDGDNFRIPNPTIAVDGGMLTFANVTSSVRTVSMETQAPDITVRLSDPVPNAAIYYTTDGTMPTARSKRYQNDLQFAAPPPGKRMELTTVAILPDGRVSTPSELLVTGSQ